MTITKLRTSLNPNDRFEISPCYVAFQMAEVAISKNLFAEVLRMIAELRHPPIASTG